MYMIIIKVRQAIIIVKGKYEFLWRLEVDDNVVLTY